MSRVLFDWKTSAMPVQLTCSKCQACLQVVWSTSGAAGSSVLLTTMLQGSRPRHRAAPPLAGNRLALSSKMQALASTLQHSTATPRSTGRQHEATTEPSSAPRQAAISRSSPHTDTPSGSPRNTSQHNAGSFQPHSTAPGTLRNSCERRAACSNKGDLRATASCAAAAFRRCRLHTSPLSRLRLLPPRPRSAA